MEGSHNALRGETETEMKVKAWQEEGGRLLHRLVLESCETTPEGSSDDMFYSIHRIMAGVGVSDGCARNRNQATPLHIAVKYDNLELVKLLFEDCIDTEAQSSRGATPLHNACRVGFPGIVKYLVDPPLPLEGCKLDARQKEGDTPLHSAIRYNNPDNVRAMVEAGADTTLENDAGQTPMDVPCVNTTRSALTESIIHRIHSSPAATQQRLFYPDVGK